MGNVLADAVSELVRNGWTKGELGHVDGPKCALGAISAVTGQRHNANVLLYPQPEHESFAAVRFLAERVNGEILANVESAYGGIVDFDVTNAVHMWNDSAESAEVVRDAMLAAAVAWEAVQRDGGK